MSPAGRRRSASAPPYRGLSLPAHCGRVMPSPWRGRAGPGWALFFGVGPGPGPPLGPAGTGDHPLDRQRLGRPARRPGPGVGEACVPRGAQGSARRPSPPRPEPAASTCRRDPGGAFRRRSRSLRPRPGNPAPVSKTPVDPARAADNRNVTVSVAGGEETRPGRVPEVRGYTRHRRATGSRRPVLAPCLRTFRQRNLEVIARTTRSRGPMRCSRNARPAVLARSGRRFPLLAGLGVC